MSAIVSVPGGAVSVCTGAVGWECLLWLAHPLESCLMPDAPHLPFRESGHCRNLLRAVACPAVAAVVRAVEMHLILEEDNSIVRLFTYIFDGLPGEFLPLPDCTDTACICVFKSCLVMVGALYPSDSV